MGPSKATAGGVRGGGGVGWGVGEGVIGHSLAAMESLPSWKQTLELSRP